MFNHCCKQVSPHYDTGVLQSQELAQAQLAALAHHHQPLAMQVPVRYYNALAGITRPSQAVSAHSEVQPLSRLLAPSAKFMLANPLHERMATVR